MLGLKVSNNIWWIDSMTQNSHSLPTSLKSWTPHVLSGVHTRPWIAPSHLSRTTAWRNLFWIHPWVPRSLWGPEFPWLWAFPRSSISLRRHLAMQRGSSWGLWNNARHPSHARSSAHIHTYRLKNHKLLITDWLLGLNYEGMWRNDDPSIQQFEGFLALPWSKAIGFIVLDN